MGGWGTIYIGLVINIGLVLIPNVCLIIPDVLVSDLFRRSWGIILRHFAAQLRKARIIIKWCEALSSFSFVLVALQG